MPASPRAESLAQQAGFVFKGTVKKLKAATMRGVPVSDRTVVVRVDEVMQAPEMLTEYSGRDITVQLSGRQKVKVGQQAVFYADGWLFGEGLAVQSAGLHAVGKAAAALSAGGDAVQNRADREMQTRLASADVVVHGRVSSVRLPAETPTFRAATAEVTASTPISEHDPLWREAVIEVGEVQKGNVSQKKVVVRFPSSTDVSWHNAPKFHPGQEGVFILHKGQGEEGAERMAERAAAGEGEEIYTALHPADFQPAHS